MASETICSEITGSVWKVLAQAGDTVEAEAPILIIESMKMEIPVLTPSAGRVARILVAEGDAVSEGQEVAIVET